MNRIHLSNLAAAVALLSCGLANAQSYTVTSLVPPGYLESFFLGAGGTQAAGYGDFAVDVSGVPDARDVHAFVWNQDTQTRVDLDPGGITSATFASGAFGGYQVGQIVTSLNGGQAASYAALWHGTADSLVLLNTPGFHDTYAYANSATEQVGLAAATGSSSSVPFVWAGTAASGHELTAPSALDGPDYSGTARAISGQRIIGTVSDDVGFNAAVYWPSSSAEGVVLRPVDFDETFGDAVSGNHALIEGAGAIGRHLLLWNLDDNTSVDLHPKQDADVLYSYGTAMSDTEQVGIVAVNDPDNPGNRLEHAAVWFGSADSFIDLHNLLPAEYSSFLYSHANGIDQYGNIYGYVFNVPTGPYIAVRWSPVVPEPVMLAALVPAVLLRRRRK